MVNVLSRRGCTTAHDLETERGICIEVSSRQQHREKRVKELAKRVKMKRYKRKEIGPFIFHSPEKHANNSEIC